MTRKGLTLPAVALLAAFVGAGGLVLMPVQEAVAASGAEAPPSAEHGFLPGRHIEGRIAFLKAEIKITAAQEPQWDRVAAVMREDARQMDQALEQMRARSGQAQTAVARLEDRARFATMRAQQTQRFLDVFKPLYASLSSDQQKAADELLAHHWHHHHRA